MNAARPEVVPRLTKSDAFLRAFAIGQEFERDSRKFWPRDRGRRPELAATLAIEVMYVWVGLSDGEIRTIVNHLLLEGKIAIGGLKGDVVNDRWVTRRREIAKIKRPLAA